MTTTTKEEQSNLACWLGLILYLASLGIWASCSPVKPAPRPVQGEAPALYDEQAEEGK